MKSQYHMSASLSPVLEPLEPRLLLAESLGVEWGTYLGGANNDSAEAVAADSSGNAYVAGYTAHRVSATSGDVDVFVSKFSPSGALVWTAYLRGRAGDQATSVAVDGAGGVYVAGITESTDFPTTGGAYPTYGGGTDAFVAKLSSAGRLLWSTYLGGSGEDWPYAVAAAGADVCVVGYTYSGNFPTPGHPGSRNGTVDGFLFRFSASGAPVWGTYYGGSSDEDVRNVMGDDAGNVYVAGLTSSTTLPTTAGAYDRDYNGGTYDAFVAKFDAAGALGWATYLGGGGQDQGTGIALYGSSLYVSGGTDGAGFPTPDGYDTTHNGDYDAFLAKFDTGGALEWGTYLGGSAEEDAVSVAVDSGGNAFLTGTTTSDDFPTPGGFLTQRHAAYDGFVAEFTPEGQYAWGTYLGGKETDEPAEAAVDSSGNVFVAGMTRTPNLPFLNKYDPRYNGMDDGFLVKLSRPAPLPAMADLQVAVGWPAGLTLAAPGERFAAPVTITNAGTGKASGRVYVGLYWMTDPSPLNPDDEIVGRGYRPVGYRTLNLAPGQSVTIMAGVRLSAGVAPGLYYLGALVDSYDAIFESDELNNTAATDAAVDLALRFGTFGTHRNSSLALQGSAGNRITFALSGAGFGEVQRSPSYADAFDVVTYFGTGARSSAAITCTRPDAGVLLKDVVVEGSLRSLAARDADLDGTVYVSGTLGSLRLDQLFSKSLIDIRGTATPAVPTAVTLGTVFESMLLSDSPIKSLTAVDWVRGAISAPSLGALKITGNRDKVLHPGDLSAELTLMDPAAVLTRVTVAHEINGGAWGIMGGVGTISAGGIWNWTADIMDDIQRLTVGVDFWSSGITARSIGTLRAAKYFVDNTIRLTRIADPLKPTARALGTLAVGDLMSGVTLLSAGNVGTISAKIVMDSTLYAGVADDLTSPPDTADDFVAGAAIGAVTISSTLSNTSVAAWRLGRLRFSFVVNTNDAGTPFGVSAARCAALDYTSASDSYRYYWSPGEPGMVSDGNFTIWLI